MPLPPAVVAEVESLRLKVRDLARLAVERYRGPHERGVRRLAKVVADAADKLGDAADPVGVDAAVVRLRVKLVELDEMHATHTDGLARGLAVLERVADDVIGEDAARAVKPWLKKLAAGDRAAG